MLVQQESQITVFVAAFMRYVMFFVMTKFATVTALSFFVMQKILSFKTHYLNMKQVSTLLWIFTQLCWYLNDRYLSTH